MAAAATWTHACIVVAVCGAATSLAPDLLALMRGTADAEWECCCKRAALLVRQCDDDDGDGDGVGDGSGGLDGFRLPSMHNLVGRAFTVSVSGGVAMEVGSSSSAASSSTAATVATSPCASRPSGRVGAAASHSHWQQRRPDGGVDTRRAVGRADAAALPRCRDAVAAAADAGAAGVLPPRRAAVGVQALVWH
jgi:hypothetical protein